MPKGVKPPTAWKPGQSGNPNGSRGRKIMADALGLALNRKADKAGKALCAGMDIDPNEIKRIHVIAEQLGRKAAEGDITAIREIFDRIDGKVPQQTDVKVTQTPLDEVDAATLTALLAQLGRIADQRDSQADSGDESATRH